MRVAHVYDGHEMVYDGRGSVPDVVWNIAKHTAAKGHDVRVIERNWEGLDRTEVREGVQFERLRLRTGSDEPWEDIPYQMVASAGGVAKLLVDRTNFAVQTLRALRRTEYDVIHVHLPFTANVLATVAPWLREKMVYTAHIGEIEKRVTDPRVSPDVYLANRAARTFVLNPEMRSAFEERGVPSERLTVVPNGVDLDRFDDLDSSNHERVRREYDLLGDQVVLFVGTITPRKGIADLVEAVAQIDGSDALDDAQFVLVGRTDLEAKYVDRIRSAVEENGLEDEITFTGFISNEDLLTLYDLADLFVLPSYEEGSSVAVTEAIASGTPVVATDIGGTAQQIVEGTHGYLVPPGSPGELGERMEYVLTHPQKHRDMKRAVRDRADEFSWERITDRITDTYRRLPGSDD